MKTLEDFNRDRGKAYTLPGQKDVSVPNGIKCPHCGRELLDASPNIILTSYPPKMSVYCGYCEFKDYRIA